MTPISMNLIHTTTEVNIKVLTPTKPLRKPMSMGK